MKKIIFIVLITILLTGCSNSINFDFKDNITTEVKLSFSLDEYKYYSNRNSTKFSNNEETISSINAIRNDREAFITGNNNLFFEKYFTNNGNSYSAVYNYTYTYSNFSKNYLLNNCFEYFGVEEDAENIYVYLSGRSLCAPFNINIRAVDRMINNNAYSVNNGQYTWQVKETNNNIYFLISKEKINSQSIDMLYVIYFILGMSIAFVVLIFSKKKR